MKNHFKTNKTIVQNKLKVYRAKITIVLVAVTLGCINIIMDDRES